MSDRPAMTPEERAARTARIRAERVARGQEPTIQSPAVYRLLAACLTANAEKAAAES